MGTHVAMSCNEPEPHAKANINSGFEVRHEALKEMVIV